MSEYKKEVFEPQIEREEFNKPKINTDFIKRKTNSKTFRGYLNGLIQKANKDKNKEMVIFLEEILNKFNEFYPQKIVKSEIEILNGWKGKGGLEIYRGFENDIIIKEHIKNKEGEVSESNHTIPQENVNRIIFYIKKWEIGESHKCYDFSEIIGEPNWQEVWKKRTKVYFLKYYYPIKILEALNIIHYSSKGVITRLI